MLLHAKEKERLAKAPPWLLLPLPPNAARDSDAIAQAMELTRIRGDVCSLLDKHCDGNTYQLTANLVNSVIWEDFNIWVRSEQKLLLQHARHHMPRRAEYRVLRRLAKSPITSIRKSVYKTVRKLRIPDTTLPNDRITTRWPWPPPQRHGWFTGLRKRDFDAWPFQRGRGEAVEKLSLPPIDTIADLRALLRIKSSKQLGWFLQASDGEGKPYFRYTIPKRNGKQREICAPNWQLRNVQQRILQKILANVPVHDCAHGFVPGRSIVSNAQPHIGSQLVLKFDLQDFFPTIAFGRVVGLFSSLGYYGHTVRFSGDDDSYKIAATLARLCVYAPSARHWMTGYCPQGAPTSPTISNLICRGLDSRCNGLAKKFDGTYTRYADDLTFSFPTDKINTGRFRWWIDQICHQEGFYVNHKKFRFMRASRRQSVTGIVVNDCLRVPREQRRKFRAILHDAQKNGLQAASRGRPGFANWLRGYAAYLNMVQPDEGAEFVAQVRELVGKHDNESYDWDTGSNREPDDDA